MEKIICTILFVMYVFLVINFIFYGVPLLFRYFREAKEISKKFKE